MLSLIGAAVVLVLVWFYFRTHNADLIGAMMEKRRGSARIVSRADYAEGREKIAVGLALTNDTFFYENPDMQASFDLDRIDEVEYDDELATAIEVARGFKALRLRSHGTTFDFVMPNAEIERWKTMLPARQLGQPAVQAS